MIPPLISYVSFNRLGLTDKNLTSILESPDDFEMHIIDNNSTDDTWEYILGLKDSRIITKARIDINPGLIYSLNINLAKRKPEQYFITVDNDVYFETKDWISKLIKVFKKFPDLGLLGIERENINSTQLPNVIYKKDDGVAYFEIKNDTPDVDKNYVPGFCLCLRPELINQIGYFSEENYFGAMELFYRVNNFTDYKTGFASNIKISMPQTQRCNLCQYRSKCTLDTEKETCFTNYQKLNKNYLFMKENRWKLDETIIDMESGARPVYCASANDVTSLTNHVFNMDWATENFTFFIENAN